MSSGSGSTPPNVAVGKLQRSAYVRFITNLLLNLNTVFCIKNYFLSSIVLTNYGLSIMVNFFFKLKEWLSETEFFAMYVMGPIN